MIYVVAVEFAAPEGEPPVAEWLSEHFEHWAQPVPYLWIVEGALAAEQIMNGLKPLLARDDRLVIVKAGTEAMWHGVSPANARWLADNFPGSITERVPDAAEGTS